MIYLQLFLDQIIKNSLNYFMFDKYSFNVSENETQKRLDSGLTYSK